MDKTKGVSNLFNEFDVGYFRRKKINDILHDVTIESYEKNMMMEGIENYKKRFDDKFKNVEQV